MFSAKPVIMLRMYCLVLAADLLTYIPAAVCYCLYCLSSHMTRSVQVHFDFIFIKCRPFIIQAHRKQFNIGPANLFPCPFLPSFSYLFPLLSLFVVVGPSFLPLLSIFPSPPAPLFPSTHLPPVFPSPCPFPSLPLLPPSP